MTTNTKKMNISAVLITKNAATTLELTLESLKEFEEVILLDTGSSDHTIEIARKFKNVKIYKTSFSGFGRAKNSAAKLAKFDWIFSIDADEVADYELLNSIKTLSLKSDMVYRYRRYNFYRNKMIRNCGWGKEYVSRLYNRKFTQFNEKLVHEHIISTGKEKVIKGGLIHYSYLSISDFSRKRDLYSELFAFEHRGKRKSSPFMAFIRGTYAFLNTFFIRFGLFDGYRGLLISVANAHVTFTKYLKLYEANIELDILKKSILLKTALPVHPDAAVKQIEAITKIQLEQAIDKVSIYEIENIKSNLTILN